MGKGPTQRTQGEDAESRPRFRCGRGNLGAAKETKETDQASFFLFSFPVFRFAVCDPIAYMRSYLLAAVLSQKKWPIIRMYVCTCTNPRGIGAITSAVTFFLISSEVTTHIHRYSRLVLSCLATSEG